jgi:O-antigen/teichoic acid export membrane protein
MTLVYVGSSLLEYLHYFYRGLSRSDLESSLTLLQRISMLVLSVAVLTWRPTLTWLASAMLLPVVTTLIVSARLAARLGRRAAALGQTSGQAPACEGGWAAFRRDVLPIGAGVVLSALYFRIDVFLVAIWTGTESAGLYNAVFRLVEALRLFPAAVMAVELPQLCRAETSKLLVRVSAAVVAFAFAATIVLAIAAPWGIPLVYGEGFTSAVPAFRILLWSFPLMSLNYALTHQLIGWDGQKPYAIICGIALAANVAMNGWAIPAFGIVGAAWSTFWTEAVLTGGCALALRWSAPRGAMARAGVTAVS